MNEKNNKIFNSFPKEKAIEIMKNSNNIHDFLGKIDQIKNGSNYRKFYNYCTKYNINYKQYFKCSCWIF